MRISTTISDDESSFDHLDVELSVATGKRRTIADVEKIAHIVADGAVQTFVLSRAEDNESVIPTQPF